ncbi:MAG: hypothetical protein Q4D87_03995 [Actinomycetaceae bacterium]|nr:hypothetical protein [Actinomycetaceae bacterium]
MSENHRDMPGDQESSQSSDSGDFESTPDFEQSLEELNSAMVSGALANKLRGRFKRHSKEVRDELAAERAIRESIEREANDSKERTDASKGRGAADSSTDLSDDSSDFSSSDFSGDEGEHGSADSDSSKHTRDFLASLDERFPGVSGGAAGSDREVPPPPPADDEDGSSASAAGAAGAATGAGAGAAGVAGAAGIAGMAGAAGAGAASAAKHVAEGSRKLMSKSRTFMDQTAERIAAKAAERQERLREKREAERETNTDAGHQSERQTGAKPEQEPKTGVTRKSRAEANREAQAQSVELPPPPKRGRPSSKPSWHAVNTTPPPAPVRHAGDTDNLEAVDSLQPKQVKFTRKGSPILKLPAGTRVLQNSMQSVRSTVNALNAGERIDPTRPTIALFAVLALVAAVLASTTLLGTGKLPQAPSAFLGDTEQTQQATEQPTDAAQDAAPAPAGPAPEIASIEVISYNADGGDHQEWAEFMYDGDVGTRWQSRYFAQPELPQDNTIRLIIHLKESTAVSGVTFSGPIDGGQVDLRINDGTDPFGTPVITSSQMSATTQLAAPEPVVGNTVTLNFVSLPTEDEGRNRVKIDELTVQ